MVFRKDKTASEKKTLLEMVRIYCRRHHQQSGKELCEDCRQLLEYAYERLDGCKFGDEKPVCSKCKIHCYKPVMREKIQTVMRYSGPRMAFKHPFMSLEHLFRSRKS